MLCANLESFYCCNGSVVQMPKYPDITVELVGKDGNAFNILGICRRAMQYADLPESEIEAFTAEATSGDYNHLSIIMRWF